VRSLALVTLALFLTAAGFAQQVQTSDVANTQPLQSVNVKYVQGVGPGYWPTAGSGLTLNLAKGTAFCSGAIATYAGGTLTMTNSATNYIYLDPTSSCAPAVSTSAFTAAQIPIAVVIASGGAITTITDDRTWFSSLNPSSVGATGCGVNYSCAYYPNDTGTGTTLNHPVKGDGAQPLSVLSLSSADYAQGRSTGLIGFCVAGCGTSGMATIAYAGNQVPCVFDNVATKGDFVEVGTTGLCSDNVLAGFNENPEVHLFFGKVHTTIGSAGTTTIDLMPFGSYGNFGSGANGPYFVTNYGGGQMSSLGTPFEDTRSPGTAALPAFNFSGISRWPDGSSFFVDMYDFLHGASGHDIELDLQHGWGAGQAAFRINGAHYGVPEVNSSISGSVHDFDFAYDSHLWTLTGNTTISTVDLPNAGHIQFWNICQDATGGRTFTASMIINMPTISATANACTSFTTITVDATHLYAAGGGGGGGGGGVTGSGTSGKIPKWTSSSALGDSAASDIVNEFSGCSGTQYLGADGSCHSASGSPGGTNHQTQINSSGAFGGVGPGTSGECYMSNGASADPSFQPCGGGGGGGSGGPTYSTVSTPATPTLATNGSAGSTSISYKVVGCQDTACTLHTAASSAATIATANATLSATNSVNISLYGVYGVQCYNVYRTAAGGTPSTTGLVGTCVSQTYKDVGGAGDGSTAPSTNTTILESNSWQLPGASIPVGGLIGIDAPPASPTATDEECNETSLTPNTTITTTAGWYWLNQGSSTLTVANGECVLSLATGADQLFAIVQPAPASTPWTYTAKISLNSLANFAGNGIVLYESATGKALMPDLLYNSGDIQISLYPFTNPTTRLGAPLNFVWRMGGTLYERVQYDGTNINISVSPWGDGQNFYQIWTEAKTVHFTSAPNFVGWGMEPQGTSANPKASMDWIRRTQ
jgi:hypothetical protein